MSSLPYTKGSSISDGGDSSRPPLSLNELSAIDFHAGPPGGDATRHLRAAAYLDGDFRRQVIEELVENNHRVPAPTPGVDAAGVLRECLRARREIALAGGLVIMSGVFVAIFSLSALSAAVLFLVIGRCAGWAARIATRRLGVWMYGTSDRKLSIWTQRILTLLFFPLIVMLLLVIIWVWSIFHAGSLFTNFLFSGPSTGPSGSRSPGDAASGSDYSGWLSDLLLLVWVAIGAVFRYRRHVLLASLSHPRPSAEAEPVSQVLGSILHRLRVRPSEVETIYSTSAPFVGCGVQARSEAWSIVIELRPNAERQAEGRAPDPLDLPTLHQAIAARLTGLGRGELYPGDLLHRITVRDRVFRSGLRNDHINAWFGYLGRVDPEKRVQQLIPEWVDLLDLGSHEQIRHYLEARAELWQYQVVATLFIRAYVQGDLLRLEGLPFILPPISKEYRAVDEILRPDLLTDVPRFIFQAIGGLAKDVSRAPSGPWAIVRSNWRTWSCARWLNQMLREGRPVDFGPRISMRELGAEPFYQQIFQKVDVDRFFASVGRRAVTAVLDELERCGYDTSEFSEITQQININSSTIQNIGSTVNGPQAAGREANAQQVTTREPQLGSR